MTTRIVVASCLAVFAFPVPASGQAAGIVAIAAAGFRPEEGAVLSGSRLFLVNADYPGEQSTHDLRNPDGLFSSDLTNTGEIAEVRGVSDLGPGRYPFRCSVHPVTMTGTLVVIAP